MTRHALYVELKARSGKEDGLAAFLAGAKPQIRRAAVLADKLPA